MSTGGTRTGCGVRAGRRPVRLLPPRCCCVPLGSVRRLSAPRVRSGPGHARSARRAPQDRAEPRRLARRQPRRRPAAVTSLIRADVGDHRLCLRRALTSSAGAGASTRCSASSRFPRRWVREGARLLRRVRLRLLLARAPAAPTGSRLDRHPAGVRVRTRAPVVWGEPPGPPMRSRAWPALSPCADRGSPHRPTAGRRRW